MSVQEESAPSNPSEKTSHGGDEMEDFFEPSCWICLESEPDEVGQPVSRGCACRGDSAGYVHVSCLAKYARNKMGELYSQSDDKDKVDCTVPWRLCPNCKQKYTGGVRKELTEHFVKCTADLKKNDGRRLEALLCAADELRFLLAKDAATQAYEDIIAIIDSVFPEYPGDLSMATCGEWENCIKCLCYRGIMKSGVRRVDKQMLDKMVSCIKSDGTFTFGEGHLYVDVVSTLQEAASKLGKRDDPKTRKLLHNNVANFERSSDSFHLIKAYQDLAASYALADDYDEAIACSERAKGCSERVLGPAHETTVIIQTELKSYRAHREIDEAFLKNAGVFFAVLPTPNKRIDSNGIIVLRPSFNNKLICVVTNLDTGLLEKVKIESNKLCFGCGTPVLVGEHQLKGRITESDVTAKRYKVVVDRVGKGHGKKCKGRKSIIEGTPENIFPDFSRVHKDP